MSSEVSQNSVRTICKHRSPDMEPDVWAAALKEADNGWLTFRPSQDISQGSVVSSRFGVKQKNKAIDNFRYSLVNAACGVREKVAMDGVDELVSFCLRWLRRRKPVHPDVRVVGRTWGLKSACKQLAVRADHKRFAVICMIDPKTNQVKIAGSQHALRRVCGCPCFPPLWRGAESHWPPQAPVGYDQLLRRFHGAVA